jgi:hypothetical protein
MKRTVLKRILPAALGSIPVLLFNASLYAQQKVEIEGQAVGNFFERNWMWITGVIVLLLLIIIFSRNTAKRTTTTIMKDSEGNVKTVKTTQTKD